MARLEIPLYPKYSTLGKDEIYVILAAKYGFKRIFACLLSVDKERKEILAEPKELIDHAHSYGMEVILGAAPFVSKKLHISHDDLLFSVEMHADGIHLDKGFGSLKEALITYNPQSLKVEINASLDTKYLDNIMSYCPKLENIITCHSFYPQHYSGVSYEYFERCSQGTKDLSIRVVAFIFSQEGGVYGPWPVSEGLCTLEIHRDLPIDVQARHPSATRLMDDVIIANTYASEEESSMLSKIDPGKLTFRTDFEAGLHPTEEKILYEYLHFVHGDMSEYMAGSTVPRVTCAKESVPPENTRDLKYGDVVVANDGYSRYRKELHIVLKDIPGDGRRNVIGHVPEDENILLGYIKP